MTTRTTIPDPIPEKSTRAYTCTLVDHATQEAIPRTNVTSIKLWLTGPTGTINSRSGQALTLVNVLHATSGLFTFTLTPDDNPIQGSLHANRLESHILLFQVIYVGGEEWHEVELFVENLSGVPPV